MGELALLVEGFYDVIPKKALHGADLRAIELELIVAGPPHVDLEDWKKHTTTSGKPANANVVVWFWEVLSEMDQTERAKVLSFSCGSGRLPANGFSSMRPQFSLRVIGLEEGE